MTTPQTHTSLLDLVLNHLFTNRLTNHDQIELDSELLNDGKLQLKINADIVKPDVAPHIKKLELRVVSYDPSRPLNTEAQEVLDLFGGKDYFDIFLKGGRSSQYDLDVWLERRRLGQFFNKQEARLQSFNQKQFEGHKAEELVSLLNLLGVEYGLTGQGNYTGVNVVPEQKRTVDHKTMVAAYEFAQKYGLHAEIVSNNKTTGSTLRHNPENTNIPPHSSISVRRETKEDMLDREYVLPVSAFVEDKFGINLRKMKWSLISDVPYVDAVKHSLEHHLPPLKNTFAIGNAESPEALALLKQQ